MSCFLQCARRVPILPLSRSSSTFNTARLASALQKNAPIDVHPEVEYALAKNKPVVALETAIVTHGMPYPTNLELSLELEDIIRSTGSVPAIIGFVEGRVKIGLTKPELERLADSKLKASKISRRDIAAAIATKADGGTTCSATLIFAALAGIKVFSTGGLGGVHRGGENTMDISADLHELTRCPVGLVSSGVKSILDIGRTLEYLETLGVPVISYGDSKQFPAFFSRHSGFEAPWNVTNPAAAAAILHAQWQLGMDNGALIAVPIPEKDEANGKSIQKFIEQAVAESESNGISKRGKEATPWLLARINELSKGGSLAANIALIKNTALVGGQIAVQYHNIMDETGLYSSKNSTTVIPDVLIPAIGIDSGSPTLKDNNLPPADIIIIGSAAIDITAQTQTNVNPALAVHSTAPGSVSLSLGGVARNVAEACSRVITARSSSLSSLLIAPIGDDPFGHLLTEETARVGMRTDGLLTSNKRTAVCNMVLDSHGSLVGGVADMDITKSFTAEMIVPEICKHKPRIVALDGNLSPETITAIVQHCAERDVKIFFEPTSVIKSTTILPAIGVCLDKASSEEAPITYFSPNLLELAQVYQAARSDLYDLMSHKTWWATIDSLALGSAFRMDLEQLAKRNVSEEDHSKGTLAFLVDEGTAQIAVNLLPFFQHLIIKCGDKGVLVAMRILEKDAEASNWARERSNPRQRRVVARGRSNETIIIQHFPALPIEKIINVTGAGDSFGGALLARLGNNVKALQSQKELDDIICAAQMAAILSLESHFAVSPLLSKIGLL